MCISVFEVFVFVLVLFCFVLFCFVLLLLLFLFIFVFVFVLLFCLFACSKLSSFFALTHFLIRSRCGSQPSTASSAIHGWSTFASKWCGRPSWCLLCSNPLRPSRRIRLQWGLCGTSKWSSFVVFLLLLLFFCCCCCLFLFFCFVFLQIKWKRK